MTQPLSSPRLCLCGHPESDHWATTGDTSCMHRACGCDSYRKRPAVGDEAERWLASRTPGENAPKEGAALWA